MTSIATNNAASIALATLRSISSQLDTTNTRVSTGKAVNSAADGAAYWSISTTMRSDMTAISAVRDSLHQSEAATNVAYGGMNEVIKRLGDIKARLVMASSSQADLASLQTEISSLAATTETVAQSANFAGQNWLSTDVGDMMLPSTDRSVKLVSAFSRKGDSVSVSTIPVDMLATSLYNVDGGGILQKDARSPQSIGGIRSIRQDGTWTASNIRTGSRADLVSRFEGPLTFGGNDSLSFDITVDADNPNGSANGGISAPYGPGVTSSVLIDRAVIDRVLPNNAGVISNFREMTSVLDAALSRTGAYSTIFVDYMTNQIIPDIYGVASAESSGLDGSAVSITNLRSTVGTGGLTESTTYGSRGSSSTLSFQPFTVYPGVQIDFNFSFNSGAVRHVQLTTDSVNSALGKTDGRVATADDMVTLLQATIGQPGLLITNTGSNQIVVKTDPAQDRLNGRRTNITFGNINVNIEPTTDFNLTDIDILANPSRIPQYIQAVDAMTSKAVNGAAMLGGLTNRLGMQAGLATATMDIMGSAIGTLTDTDMEQEATKLKALQTQQQLAVQSLSIANGNVSNVIALFR